MIGLAFNRLGFSGYETRMRALGRVICFGSEDQGVGTAAEAATASYGSAAPMCFSISVLTEYVLMVISVRAVRCWSLRLSVYARRSAMCEFALQIAKQLLDFFCSVVLTR